MPPSRLLSITLLCSILWISGMSQASAQRGPLKTYSGSYMKGTVTYTYYEDAEGEQVYHGRYSYKGTKLVSSLSQKEDIGWIGGSWSQDMGGDYTEEGEFRDGLLSGEWIFLYKGVIERNPTGNAVHESDITQRVAGRFESGCRTGKWSIQGTLLSKEPELLSQTMSATVEFMEGHFVGAFEYSCQESGMIGDDGFSVAGRFDANGHLHGEWTVLADNGNWVAGTRDPRELRYVIDHGIIRSAILRETTTGKVLDQATSFERHDADNEYIGKAHARISAAFGYEIDGPEGCEGYPRVRIHGEEGDRIYSEYHYGRMTTLLHYDRDTSAAMAQINQAIALNPAFYWYRREKAVLLASLEQNEASVAEFDTALALARISINPNSAVAQVQRARGMMLVGMQQYDSAYAALTEGLSLDPGNDILWVNLGIASYESGRHDEAFTALDRAVQLRPDDEYALWTRAYYLLAVKRYEKALEDCLDLVRLDLENATYRASLGWAYYGVGEFEKSIFHSQRAVEMDPGLTFARYNIAIAQLRLGRTAEAVETFRSVQRPNDAVEGAITDLKEMIEQGVMVSDARSILKEIFNQ